MSGASFYTSLVFLFILHRYRLIEPIYTGLFGFDYDPAYVYLLNGLSLAEFFSPHHIDHPGTATQLLVALVLRGWQLLAALLSGHWRSLYEMVSQDPETALFVVAAVSSALYSGIVILIGISAASVVGLGGALPISPRS